MAAADSKKDDFTSLLDAELPQAVAQGKASGMREVVVAPARPSPALPNAHAVRHNGARAPSFAR